VLLVSHGTVESLDDLPAFLANIRRGSPAPPELALEVRRRYEAIGGRSPLNEINRALARRLEERLGLPTRFASRLFHPYPKEVLAELAAGGARRVVAVPLAQHSAGVYGAAVQAAAKELGGLEVACAPNWGRTAELTRAYAEAVRAALATVDAPAAETAIVFTAHSLPVAIVQAGDPYEREVRASAAAIAGELAAAPGQQGFAEHVVAFQSQGIGTGVAWLGPDLRATLEALAARGRRHVVLAPVGFLADHVEILYDLDIEAKAWGRELGLLLYRSASLNDGDGIVDALAAVTRETLAGVRGG
jgi:ferrochelatase